MPSKLHVEMHLTMDENSSAVQRCLHCWQHRASTCACRSPALPTSLPRRRIRGVYRRRKLVHRAVGDDGRPRPPVVTVGAKEEPKGGKEEIGAGECREGWAVLRATHSRCLLRETVFDDDGARIGASSAQPGRRSLTPWEAGGKEQEGEEEKEGRKGGRGQRTHNDRSYELCEGSERERERERGNNIVSCAHKWACGEALATGERSNSFCTVRRQPYLFLCGLRKCKLSTAVAAAAF